VPPFASGQVHLPPSRFMTSRFTFGGTEARRFSCWAMSSSSAEVSTCSSVAPGRTWDWPALAFFSRARNAGETVTCIRVSVRVSGSTMVRRTSGTELANSAGACTRPGWARSRPTSWTLTGAGATGARSGTTVTTVLVSTTSAGRISATTCLASSFEQRKNLAGTVARFSSVMTLASCGTFETQSRPSRRGSASSGKRPRSRAATWR
jgi:hypothetical protein